MRILDRCYAGEWYDYERDGVIIHCTFCLAVAKIRMHDAGDYAIVCDCGYSGPQRETEAEAIAEHQRIFAAANISNEPSCVAIGIKELWITLVRHIPDVELDDLRWQFKHATGYLPHYERDHWEMLV